jgi:hypothetical protein
MRAARAGEARFMCSFSRSAWPGSSGDNPAFQRPIGKKIAR